MKEIEKYEQRRRKAEAERAWCIVDGEAKEMARKVAVSHLSGRPSVGALRPAPSDRRSAPRRPVGAPNHNPGGTRA